jgi:hypothetical protein
MRAGQFEGSKVMVECCALPTARCMARCAICTKLAIMLIIGTMAGITIAGGPFEEAILMAGLTFYLRVCTFELERKPAVINLRVVPTRWIMA